MIGDECDFEEAWKFFTWLEAIDWKVLPIAGGLQDQDEVLMENIFRIVSVVRKVKKAANG